MKRHIKGKKYDLTQENLDGIVDQLENLSESLRLSGRLAEVRLSDHIRLVKRLADTEQFMAHIACFGNLEALYHHRYEGHGPEAREYFDKYYGPDYCTIQDAKAALKYQEDRDAWKEVACRTINDILKKTTEDKK